MSNEKALDSGSGHPGSGLNSAIFHSCYLRQVMDFSKPQFFSSMNEDNSL